VRIVDQQNIDTTTPAGKLLFQLTGAFAEFERLARCGGGSAGRGPNPTRSSMHAKGIGIGKVARAVGLGVGTVHRLKRA
jgi:DNA invertase Pin-like site-specific DNA recombinase